MRNPVIFIVLILVAACSGEPSADQVIERSIRFHDPEGSWNSLNAAMQFEESRPGGEARRTMIRIDNTRSYFRINRHDAEEHGMVADSCFVIRGEVDCDRAITMRNYYTYLWGLPMKLKDPGTTADKEVKSSVLNGRPVYIVTIPYEKDAWEFYFARNNYELLAYKFEKPDGSGEYILTDGVASVSRMKLPNNRSWYTLDSTFLGKDVLLGWEE